MTKYEIMFIVKATLDDAALKSTTSDIQTLINIGDSKVIDFKDMGKKKLAYQINKEVSGHYYLMNVEASHDVIQEFDRKLRINEKVLRHLILKKESE